MKGGSEALRVKKLDIYTTHCGGHVRQSIELWVKQKKDTEADIVMRMASNHATYSSLGNAHIEPRTGAG